MTAPLLQTPGPSGELALLRSGTTTANSGWLLSNELLEPLFQWIRRMNYEYVLIDTPPLLSSADARALSQWCTRMLIVADLDRLRPENAVDLSDILDRLHANALGLVVIGR